MHVCVCTCVPELTKRLLGGSGRWHSHWSMPLASQKSVLYPFLLQDPESSQSSPKPVSRFWGEFQEKCNPQAAPCGSTGRSSSWTHRSGSVQGSPHAHGNTKNSVPRAVEGLLPAQESVLTCTCTLTSDDKSLCSSTHFTSNENKTHPISPARGVTALEITVPVLFICCR